MPVKLIATDLDGTLLDSHGNLDQARFKKVYTALCEAGVQLVIASGRQAIEMAEQFQAYPDLWLVGSNGAETMQPRTSLIASTFAPETVRQILTVLAAYPEVKIAMCGFENVFVKQTTNPRLLARLQNYYYDVAKVHHLAAVNAAIVKFNIFCPPELTEQLQYELTPKLAGLAQPIVGEIGSLDLIQPGLDKGKAVRALSRRLGITADQMVAFGAGENDLTLLQHAHTGIAVPNAPAWIQAQADTIMDIAQTTSVLAYIERRILPHLKKSLVFSEN